LKKFIATLIACALSGVFAMTADAHSALESSTPKSGATLAASPAVIELTFKDAVRLTSVVVRASNMERKLSFSPVAPARHFSIAAPQLASGRNEIQWKALSNDGHVVSGTLVYTIQAAHQGSP